MMLNTLRILFIALSLILGIAACLPLTVEGPYPPPAAITTSVPKLTNLPLARTPTPTRPQEIVTGTPSPILDPYCYHTVGPQFPVLPVSDAQGLNEDQIARKLIELFLSYYHASQTPDSCRIEEYRIDRVDYFSFDYPIFSPDPKSEFTRAVSFSVKPVQPYFWEFFPGELDQDNWFHSGANVVVFRSKGGYTMRFPSPMNVTMTPTIVPTFASSARMTTTKTPPTLDAYCYRAVGSQFPVLSVSDAQGLNEDQIARKLIELLLEYYRAPQAPELCRIVEYRIDDVHYNEQYPILPLEPKGDFMRGVLYSVKPFQPYFWAIKQGKFDEENWFHDGVDVAVFRSDGGYTMQFAYP